MAAKLLNSRIQVCVIVNRVFSCETSYVVGVTTLPLQLRGTGRALTCHLFIDNFMIPQYHIIFLGKILFFFNSMIIMLSYILIDSVLP